MSVKVVCCVACNTQPPDSSVPLTRVATHGKQVASASEECPGGVAPMTNKLVNVHLVKKPTKLYHKQMKLLQWYIKLKSRDKKSFN